MDNQNQRRFVSASMLMHQCWAACYTYDDYVLAAKEADKFVYSRAEYEKFCKQQEQQK